MSFSIEWDEKALVFQEDVYCSTKIASILYKKEGYNTIPILAKLSFEDARQKIIEMIGIDILFAERKNIG